MEYTTQALARLAGTTPRTLRYYDQIGLLCPRRLSSNGYRVYGAAEVDRLQLILLYRELGLELSAITVLLDGGEAGAAEVLAGHLHALRREQARIGSLISTVEKTLQNKRGEIQMDDKEKFEGLKKRLVEDNERRYGAEVREKYGDEAVERANRRILAADEATMQGIEALTKELNDTLAAAVATGRPGGEAAQKAAALHKQWLCFYWDSYSPEAHRNITEMYVGDERFTAYYESIAPGAAAFLREAVGIYLEGK